jgi:argininosuccinate lyase
MPGYTHLQRAQPVLLAHHLMAYYQMFTRDYERFENLIKSLSVLPLGSGALSGTSLPIEPMVSAGLLGFSELNPNSMDAVASRDRLSEFIFNGALLGVNLSRLSEEIVLWSTSEFGFISLPDSLSTTSSMMPQKKNPDGAELIRGKCGRLIGNLVSILTTMKGLPLSYNRDLQEDKEPLFDSADSLKLSLRLMTAMIDKAKFNLERLAQAAEDPYVGATDLAEHLVLKGVPFREAHRQAGNLVAYAIGLKKALKELSPEELRAHCPKADPKVVGKLDAPSLIKARNTTPGGTGPHSVAGRLKDAEELLQKQRKELDS